MTFATWSLRISHSIVGASDGIVEPPRVPFETQVSPLAPCSVSAWYRLIGIPTTANPPNPITDPSGMSRTASAKLEKLSISAFLLPFPALLSYRRRPVSTLQMHERLTVGPGLRRDDENQRSCRPSLSPVRKMFGFRNIDNTSAPFGDFAMCRLPLGRQT